MFRDASFESNMDSSKTTAWAHMNDYHTVEIKQISKQKLTEMGKMQSVAIKTWRNVRLQMIGL